MGGRVFRNYLAQSLTVQMEKLRLRDRRAHPSAAQPGAPGFQPSSIATLNCFGCAAGVDADGAQDLQGWWRPGAFSDCRKAGLTPEGQSPQRVGSGKFWESLETHGDRN